MDVNTGSDSVENFLGASTDDSFASLASASLMSLVTTIPGTHSFADSSDSLLKLNFTDPFSSDSLLKLNFTDPFSSDSLLKLNFTDPFSSDSLLKLNFTDPFSSDSLLKLNFTDPFSSDSLLALNLTEDDLTNDTDPMSRLWNSSGGLNLELIGRFERNRKVEGVLLASILAIYCSLIAVGAVGNSLVVLAVARKPAMRTARNVFIINLAISDLVLCLATTPLTLVELLTQYWPLGDTPFLCRLVGTLQATSIFVSTISITAIAVDRYQVIVYATRRALGTTGALLTLPAIWATALGLALPQFLFRTLNHHAINLPGLESINFCFEEWPMEHGRATYSVFVMLVQFFVPLVTVSASYAGIVRKLSTRMKTSSSSKSCSGGGKEEARTRKTNVLLLAIALIFCLSWLPFHLYSIIVDFLNPFGEDTESMLAVYAACHVLGMSSACSNPVLYGWLNDNFRKEFTEIFQTYFVCRTNARKDRVVSSTKPRNSAFLPNHEHDVEKCPGKDPGVKNCPINSIDGALANSMASEKPSDNCQPP